MAWCIGYTQRIVDAAGRHDRPGLREPVGVHGSSRLHPRLSAQGRGAHAGEAHVGSGGRVTSSAPSTRCRVRAPNGPGTCGTTTCSTRSTTASTGSTSRWSRPRTRRRGLITASDRVLYADTPYLAHLRGRSSGGSSAGPSSAAASPTAPNVVLKVSARCDGLANPESAAAVVRFCPAATAAPADTSRLHIR